ncbi:MAG: hypothetical protein JRH10_00870 [Deltaproteobacteria bacterium]|nr:hypothetical protein [Deltaproteobacteria bacterium]
MRVFFRTVFWLGMSALVAVAALAGYGVIRGHVSDEILRGRLALLARDYEVLHERYEAAIARTAVTELRVADGRLSVVVRGVEGELREIETPYDPTKEIYVDYAVMDGRLFVRRVFAEDVAPREGVLVDPSLLAIDWDEARAAHGKAAYRTLADGSWIVTVTGGGSLGLAPAPDAPVPLSPPPALRRFEPVGADVDAHLAELRPVEVWQVVRRSFAGPDEALD